MKESKKICNINENLCIQKNSNKKGPSCQIVIECKPSSTNGLLDVSFYYNGDEHVVAFAIQEAMNFMDMQTC